MREQELNRGGGGRPGPSDASVSLCVLVKNEERDVAACLASAAGACDEALVVDTGSTDRTRECAREAGARVLEFAWTDDFAAARNFALEHARGAWVLFLDADERLGPGAAEKIRAAVRVKDAIAFRIEIVSTVGAGLPQRSTLLRLFRRDPRIRYVRRIHESVNESIAVILRETSMRVYDLDVTITHSGYTPERFAALRKRERNLRLHRLTVADAPNDPYAWYRFGDELRAADASEARAALDRAWELLLALPDAERARHVYAAEVAALRAILTLDAGDPTGARAVLERAAPAVVKTPNFRYVRALIARRLQLHREALEELDWLLAFDGKRCDAPVQPGITSILAHFERALALEGLGDRGAAEASLRRALELDPHFGRAARELARLLTDGGRAADARRGLDEYLKRNPNDGDAWALSARLALAAGSPEAAVKRFEVAASAHDAPAWVLAELAECKAMLGDLTGSLAVLDRIELRGPSALAPKPA